MGNLEAQGGRHVAIGRNAIGNIITTGDYNKIFIGRYEALRDAYIYPGEVFNRVDLDHFVGREWLLDIVDSFIFNNRRGYFILEGEAGFGKTAFLAWLVQKRFYIHNFCELTPRLDKIGDGLKSLASQLALAYDLGTEGVLPIDTASRPDFLYYMLEKAAKQRLDNEKIVLVIDALDEGGTFKDRNVLGLPKSLPEGVFIIVSQRPVSVTLNIDMAITPYFVCCLSDYKEKHEDDIRRFLYNVAIRPKIAASLKEFNYTPDKFVTILMEKCQGVWVYLHYIIPEIESGERLISELNSLPEGLVNYYVEYWSRWRENNQWYENYLPLLASLAVSQESTSVEMLKEWTGSMLPVPKLRSLLKEIWRPFLIVSLHNGQERYRFYHQSLQDLFNGRVKRENLSTATQSLLEELKVATFEAHNRLIERYLIAWGGLNNGLPGLQNYEKLTIDDGYSFRCLVAHLEASGRTEDLNHLLSLETIEHLNAWYEAKDAYGNVADYMVDVARAWQLAEEKAESKIKKGEIALTIGMETRYALISASINSISLHIPPNLLAALVRKEIWTLNKGLAYAQQIPRLETRVEALVSIIDDPSGPQIPELQREQILIKVLDAATQISDGFAQENVFVRIAPYVPESMIDEALEAVVQIQNEPSRAIVLAELTSNRSESSIKKIQDVAFQIQGKYSREIILTKIAHIKNNFGKYALPEELAELASYRSESVIKKALDEAMQIQDPYSRAGALIKIASHPKDLVECNLPEDLVEYIQKETLNAIIQIQNEYYKTKAFVRITPYLLKSMVKKALDVALQIQDGYSKATALTEIASRLPEPKANDILKDALDATKQIRDRYYWVKVLVKIIPYLSESPRIKALKEALEVATQMQDNYLLSMDETDLVLTLAEITKIAFYLPEPMMKELLDSTIQIQLEHDRVEILVKIAPYLPNSLAKELLDAVTHIQYESNRARALIGISSHILFMKEEILNVAMQIQNEYIRAETLDKISSNMDGYILNRKLCATQIQDNYDQEKALLEKTFHLPESMAKEKLDEAMQIQDDLDKAKALAKIVSLNLDIISLDSLHDILVKILHGSIYSRIELFKNLEETIPIIYKLGKKEAIDETFYAIQDVVRWWP
jgi:hypothetical protein